MSAPSPGAADGPVLEPALRRVRPFTAGLVAAVLFFGGLASFFLVLSVYLQAGTCLVYTSRCV